MAILVIKWSHHLNVQQVSTLVTLFFTSRESLFNLTYVYKMITPNVGLEPTTPRLRVSCSTDWASRAIQNNVSTTSNCYAYVLVVYILTHNVGLEPTTGTEMTFTNCGVKKIIVWLSIDQTGWSLHIKTSSTQQCDIYLLFVHNMYAQRGTPTPVTVNVLYRVS